LKETISCFLFFLNIEESNATPIIKERIIKDLENMNTDQNKNKISGFEKAF